MTRRMSEALLRIEHKLDVLVSYLHGMTDVPPAPIPRPVPGTGGETDGRCPITGSVVRYGIDGETGALARLDGLLDGLPTALPVPEPPAWQARKPLEEVIDDAE
jgi:hypothetical protein